MNLFKLMAVASLACLTQACVPTGSTGVYTPADQVGQYTAGVLENENVASIIEKTSCGGAGLHNASSQIETYEASRRGAVIRTRQNAECTKFDGNIMLPRGVSRNQGGQHAQ